MKKELLWAIITGFGLGLIITWGIISARKAVRPTLPANKPTIEETTPTPLAAIISLAIDSPLDGSIVDQETVIFQGKTKPQAIITIFTEENELILEADESGHFETEVELAGGANEISIYAFDLETGAEASASVNLVYSTAEI